MNRLSSLAVCVRACLLAAALWLSACGGGGGGGGGGSSGSKAPSLTVDPTQLTVTADAGTSSIPTAVLNITLHNGSPDGTYVGASYTTNAITGLDFTVTGAAQGTLTISFEDPSTIGLGTYADSVHVGICTDSSCTQIQSGSELIVPVTYTVTVKPPSLYPRIR